jgi:gamma-glutamylcysteine synthetase
MEDNKEMNNEEKESYEKDTLKDVLNKAAKHSKAFAEDVHLKEGVDEFYQKVKEAAAFLGKKVGEIAQDEEVKERFKDLTDPVVDSAKRLADKVNENEALKKVVDSVKEGVEDSYEYVSEKTKAYLEREDVQQNIEKAKDKTIELADKGVDKLRDWLKPDTKKGQEGKEEE